MHSPKHVRRWLGGTAATAAVVLVTSTLSGAPGYAGPAPDSTAFRDAVTPAGITEHLTALQSIAAVHDDTRASGTEGYDQSVDYVVSRLRTAGYSPTVQTFEFPFFRENAPSTLSQTSPDATTYDNPDDFSSMTYSASGTVTDATVVPVDTTLTPTETSTSGCEAADFPAEVDGAVALMQRGTCPFGDKVANAQTAGAVAAIVFNRGTPGNEGSVAGTLGAPQADPGIPALGASFALGQDLADPAGTTVSITSDTESEIRDTYNVLAETPGGKEKNTIQAGAHLDSVVAGPGINDNGSGSASLLEVAEAMADVQPRNKVRFSWWGAEELGLLGSEHYVADLAANDPAALQQIALYLNFDMVGSPNYVRFVYDGDNSAFPVGPARPRDRPVPVRSRRCSTTTSVVRTSRRTRPPSAAAATTGRSSPRASRPAGCSPGPRASRRRRRQPIYGGQAGVAYDHCYHADCDDFSNVNMDAIDEMSDAMAHAVYTYALDASSVTMAGNGGKAVRGSGTGELRRKAHDYDAPNHHAARR